MASDYANLTVRANRDGSRDYYQHDSRRGGGGGGGGAAAAMSSRGRNRYNNRKRPGFQKNRYVHLVDGDGDVSMMGDDEPRDRGRFAPYANPGSNRSRGGGNWKGRGGGGGFRGGRGNDTAHYSRDRNHDEQRQKGGNSSLSWRKIMIPYGSIYGKEFILRTLCHSTSVPFIPINYGTEGDLALFYVDEVEVGTALEKLHKKLHSPDGHLISIFVRPCAPPTCRIKDVAEHIKACIGRRYNLETGYLDLSHFNKDTGLGVYVPLNRSAVTIEVVKTIKDNITNITCLNLVGNRLSSLQHFSPLVDKVQNMKSLLLDDNLLARVADLDCFKGVGVEELTLKGNPLRKNRKSQTDLVEELRKRFPKLVRLDGEMLPPQIGFDIDNIVNLPPSGGSFFVNDDARRIAVQFLEQYYAVYDSSDRQSLIDAYHDSAIFAISTYSRNAATSPEYLRNNRNLMKVTDSDRRYKLLFRGKIDIVACLKRLPKTQHDPASFNVDVLMASATMMCITTSGIFKEDEVGQQHKRGVKEPDLCLRAFNRTFILIPNGSGFNIVNETLLITNPTSDQIRTAFKTPAPTPSPSPIPGTSTIIDPQQLRQQMITSFSQQSGMSTEWSLKCLEDNIWDFDKAATVFAELNAKGQIPREAFLQL